MGSVVDVWRVIVVVCVYGNEVTVCVLMVVAEWGTGCVRCVRA